MSDRIRFFGRAYKQVEVRTYGDSRLQILDDGGDGWVIIVHTPNARDQLVMRNSVPHGLAVLVKEAEDYIDRRMLGGRLPDYP